MKLYYLITYAVLMFLITVSSYRKQKSTIYKFLWTAYAISAIFCVLNKIFQKDLVGSGISQNMWYDLSDSTLWGYLLIIFCCLIAFKPFERFDKNSTLEFLGNSKGSRQFYVLFSYVYILLAFIYILLTFNTVISLFQINDFGALRSSLYGNSENEASFVMTTNFVANLCYKLCLQFKYLSVFISFAMIKERVKTMLATVLLFTTFLVYYLYATSIAARGGLLIFCFSVFLVGTCFYSYLSKKNKRKLFISLVLIFGVVIAFFFSITYSRFGNDHGGGNPILRNVCFYLGHGPIEFSKITGSLNRFSYGETIIGRLMNHYVGTPYSWDRIQSKIGYPPLGPVFVTYLGYLYTDFGLIGCLLFVTLWSKFLCRLLRKSPNRISTVFIFLYYLSYYVTGIFTIGRLEYAAMVTAHIIFLGIRFIEDLLHSIKKKDVFLKKI